MAIKSWRNDSKRAPIRVELLRAHAILVCARMVKSYTSPATRLFDDLRALRVRRIARGCLLATLALLWILSIRAGAEKLPMRLYTTEDGLWSGFINHMMRDSHGFIWFCTRDGLSRFDGYRFTNYRIADGPPSQNFTYMFESRKGVFWFVLSDNRVYQYDPESAKASVQPPQTEQSNDDGRVLLHAELVSSGLITGMLQDRNNNLWAKGAGLFLVKEEAGRVLFREVNLNLPHEWKLSFLVNSFAEAEDGSLWLGTTHGLLRRLPDGRVARYTLNRSIRSEDVPLVVADKGGFIWATYPGRVYVAKPEPVSRLSALGAFGSRTLIVRPPSLGALLPASPNEATDLSTLDAMGGEAREITNIYQHSNGRIWMCVKNRLVLFDGRQFHFFADARGAFRTAIEDLDGDMWIATTLGGVVRFSVRGLMSYGRPEGLADQHIASIHEDRGSHLQIVSSGWLISQFGAGKFTSVHPNIPNGTELWSSPLGFLDHTGQWWMLTRRGLYRFPRKLRIEDLMRATPLLYTNLDGLPGQWVYCMFEDSRGDLWISVRRTDRDFSGLVRWQRSDETFHRLTEKDGLPLMKAAASFGEDRAGNLWFGFYEGGLARYAGSRFTIFTAADGLPDGFITALYVDHLGRLWLTSSGGGLARIDDPNAEHPRFVRYTTQEGLSSDNARAITEDLAGDIYIGTVRGVDRLTPDTGKVWHYGLADGLAGDFVATAFRDRKGSLWFGGFSGLSRFDPQPEPVPAEPSIRVEGLRIAGVKQPISEFGASAVTGLELSAGQSNLQIDFASLSMARAALLRYQYKLQGVDHDWSAPTDQRTVHYANLAPGTYRFLVRAVDPGGLTSIQPASVAFRILPPIWQRWWFLIPAATAIGFAVTWLYRYRVAHLLELERVRTHIATDLHDDIGSSLSQIAVLSEVVRRQIDGTPAVSQPLSTIASTSRELVDSMSDIVWAINPNRDNLGDLAQRMRRFASDLFTANDIEFRFNSNENERPIKLDADVRRQLFLIFKEGAHNIVRHSECSSVEIDLRMEHHTVTLTLKDDGKGFDTAQAHHGHGLSSISHRAKTLGAVLDLSSQLGGGTVVFLKVPLTRRAAASA